MARSGSWHFWALRNYLFVRRASWLVGTAAVVALLTAAFGETEVNLPSADGDGSAVRFSRLFAVATGVLPVLTLTSRLDELEWASGRQFSRYRTVMLAAAALLFGCVLLLGVSLGGDVRAVLQTARALLGWFGLALLSGRLIGWDFSWIVPWAALSAFVYWGYSQPSQAFHWWEFSARPYNDPASSLLSVGLFGIGVAAYTLSPWRVASLRLALSRSRFTARPFRRSEDRRGG